jgi:hypothetical protein
MPHTDGSGPDRISTTDEPLWYTLSELIAREALSHDGRAEVLALAQMLHDLRISSMADLVHLLDVLYVEDHSKPLHGEYYYRQKGRTSEDRYADVAIGQMPRYKADAREMRACIELARAEPRKSNRRMAIEATKRKKAEEKESEGS